MKQFFTILFLFSLYNNIVEAQQTPTFADPPGPEHVLVVYKEPTGLTDTLGFVSDSVKEYYKDARQIPESNILGLTNLIDDDIYDPVSNTTHRIILDQQGEIIRDSINQYSSTPSIHAWLYFNERIAKPIANHLTTTYVNGVPLKDIIRFVVLVKGVPFRIDARMEDDTSGGTNVICANLLTHLGETMEDEDALLFYYNKTPGISNPYYNVDDNFSMEHRFLPNHYQTTGHGRDIKLSYLVTHLSAPRFEDIQGMIDRALNAINETDYDWFIDAKESGVLTNDANATKSIFNNLEIDNYYFETTNERITEHEKPIMSYSSDGFWAGFPPDYIQSQLTFDYADGAFFNTRESHNGLSIGTYPVERTRGQGLLADFTLMGGTVGVGQAFHSPNSSVIINNVYFPSYAVGYTFIEAAYLGLLFLDATNVVVGDPLTKIYNFPVDTLTGNVVWNDIIIDKRKVIIPEGSSLTFNIDAQVELKSNAAIIVQGTLYVEEGANVTMKNYSRIIADKIVMYEGSNLTLNDKASIIINDGGEFTIRDYAVVDLFNESNIRITGDLIIGDNVELNFYNKSELDVEGNLLIGEFVKFNIYEGLIIVKNSYVHLGKGSSFYIENGSTLLSGRKLLISGTNYSPVIFESKSQYEKQQIVFEFDSIYVNYAEFNKVEAIIQEKEGTQNGDINISNVVFRNTYNALSLFGNPNNASYTINVQYNTFENITFNSIYFTSIINAVIKNNNIINVEDYQSTSIGIVLSDCGNIEITDCFFDIKNKSAIEIGTNYKEENAEPSSYGNYTLSNLTIKGNSVSDYGIKLDGYRDNLQLVNIYNSRIENVKNAITIQNFDNFLPQIIYNEIVDFSDIGISLTAGNNALIRHNNLSTNGEANFGIFSSQVSNIIVLDNEIIGDNLYNPESGLFISSTNGDIRRNKITGFKFGIESGGSQLNLAQNEITENYEYGLNIKDGSILELGFSDIDEEGFLISGYNKIYGNGLCYEWVNSEIFVDNALIFLNNGCNTVADDRDDPNCDYRLLIDGVNVQDQIKAVENYWGEHPVYGNDPTERFGGEITVIYDDFLSEPCELTESEEFILHIAYGDIVVDTLYSTGRVTENMNQLQELYSDANKEFYTGNYSASIQKYNQIINNYGTTPGSISAYMKLYQAKKLSGALPGQFNNLKNLYISKLPAISDSVMLGIIEQLINLCIVAEEEYITAIGNFETLALDNPGTDLAFYSELNALTTSLRISSDSTLGKVSAKYAISGIYDYHERVGKLFKQRKGLYSQDEASMIPKEYYLYQNYPNPFNPVTTIRYEIPERSKVELRVYDILGKEVMTLVNEYKDAGRYEASFNASKLSSGVYIYTIQAGEFISSKKMMLVK